MTDNITPPPELVQQWANESPMECSAESWAYEMFIAHRAAQWGADQVLERRPIPSFVELADPTPDAAPVATDAEIREYAGERFPMCLRGAYNLGRQHGAAQPPAAQPAPPVAPAGGLVWRVEMAMELERSYTNDWSAEARAAIREVAAWMRENETGLNAARWLEQEADR